MTKETCNIEKKTYSSDKRDQTCMIDRQPRNSLILFRTRLHPHNYTPTHTYTLPHAHAHTHTRTHTRTHTCTRIQTDTHTLTHARTANYKFNYSYYSDVLPRHTYMTKETYIYDKRDIYI